MSDQSEPIRVIVTGGRFYDKRKHVYDVLDSLMPIYLLGHGACPYGGADILAEEWAKSREIWYQGFPAAFGTEGKSAGPMRNRLMIAAFAPDLVVAFPGGTGTADCVMVARAAGIKVTEARP